ncbi:MAG: bifunctional diaminohydroxyphosphoribosylaminopyrimidine deaminase/5-amino-6-(5-phosphoribosylamino)uracil reductase RibD [Candidatus Omnitrophica bacterium]|nr:bifunctional diaminohydroxyphosphoribosylaminopyrimidine deaminase/5-amino-6-(5-phosphoribosylamino)uracil reductase RibD [Candidatus Omnitrophota bacterium]MCM8793619.1 bifunctional diaminohydroxyphosphoribosylaminopyrimidine deaminase/5-amino-6-(5-phosphoribosylamino)uracil reductase RibD [Candidatus Omnitrophota bacterium]
MKHEDYMRIALKLAQKAKGFTNPNPLVGCVIVREGKIVGRGFHKRAGLAHAEIEAIEQAGEKTRGASLYVNLEPCSHYGRTPPCTKAIIKAGIKKVYASILDPNPLNNGRGVKELRKKGIEVELGILEEEAKKLNEVFLKYITQKIPFVTVKVAQSLDGKIATRTGESRWITSEKARDLVKELRNEVDAVMVGVNTVIKDNPLLNPKILKSKTYYKIILDSKLRIPLKAKMFSDESVGRIIIATTKYASKKKMEKLKGKAEVLVVRDKNRKVDLNALMRELGKREISHILIEGGGETIASALEEKLVDKIYFFISPKLIGGRETITSVEGRGIARLREAYLLKNIEIRRIGEDILIGGYLGR